MKDDSPELAAFARRLDARGTWDNLGLPKAETDELRAIAAELERRRTTPRSGTSAVFVGDREHATKAAEVLANQLQLDLYRVDLSAVRSKFIGETEKNLTRLFEAAAKGGPILFFDEADALFGKRTEVEDSHDRYANIEVGFLLQLAETYRGLTIFAVEEKSALDPAFIGRLRFVIQFPRPRHHIANEEARLPPVTDARAKRPARFSIAALLLPIVAALLCAAIAPGSERRPGEMISLETMICLSALVGGAMVGVILAIVAIVRRESPAILWIAALILNAAIVIYAYS